MRDIRVRATRKVAVVVISTCRRNTPPLPRYISKQPRSEALFAEHGRSDCQLKSERVVVNVLGLGYDKATAQPPTTTARVAQIYLLTAWPHSQ
jgi:hypothetical protein